MTWLWLRIGWRPGRVCLVRRFRYPHLAYPALRKRSYLENGYCLLILPDHGSAAYLSEVSGFPYVFWLDFRTGQALPAVSGFGILAFFTYASGLIYPAPRYRGLYVFTEKSA